MTTHFKSLLAIPAFMLCSIASAQWTTLSFPSNKALDKAAFPDDNTGYVANSLYNKLWRTTDAGISWDSVAFTAFVNDVDFISADTGFVLIGQGSTTYSVKSTNDGGTTWTDHPIPGTGVGYQTVYFTSKLIGYVVDYNSTVLRTADGGGTWSPLPIGSYAYGLDKEHINKDTLILAGADGTFMYKGAIYRSYDAGASWQAVIHDSSYTTFVGSHFFNGLHGYTVYSSGFSPAKTTLSKTLDGGNSWAIMYQDTNYIFQDVYMNSPVEGYLAAEGTSNGKILMTTNGTTWNIDYTIPYPIRKFYSGGSSVFGIGDGGLVIRKLNANGIAENEFELNGKIYPNPTNGVLYTGFIEPAQITIYDVNGNAVLVQNLNPGVSINLNSLTNGIYLARMKVENKMGSMKIVLNK